MSKKRISINEIGDIRKPERNEQPAIQEKSPKKRGRPAERTAYVQINTRVKIETSNQLNELAERENITIREIIERSIDFYYNK